MVYLVVMDSRAHEERRQRAHEQLERLYEKHGWNSPIARVLQEMLGEFLM